MLRASKLEAALYDEVGADTTATIQALKAALFVIWAIGIGWSIRIIIEEASVGLFGICCSVFVALLFYGSSGLSLPTLSAPDYFGDRRNQRLIVIYCVPLASQTHPTSLE